MNLLSEHNRILRVGEGGSQEYFAGPNINITDHVISGKYWDNEINSAISSTSGDIVNEAFNQSTAWVDEQGYLTAHQDVTNLPYVQNSALGYNGNLISSISGDGFFAESANNSYHADDADHATYADSATHADSADFVATANFANSASSALNAEVANVAYTALTAQFLDGGWELDVDGFITAYNNSAFAGGGGGGRYEGIEPIVVNNEEMRISAKSALLGVQDPLYFVEDSETATIIGVQESAISGKGIEYSGIAPIVVDNENHLISAQSAKLGVQGPLYFVEDTPSSTVIGIDNSAFPTFEGTPEGKISAINGSALNADPIIDYSAGNNIDITDHIISVTGSVPSADRASYAVSATSSHFSHSAIEAASANSATYDNLGREITATYLTAVTGDNTPYSAGANIDITDHVVSGKDWTTEIQAASANAVAQIPTVTGLPYVENSALDYTPGGHLVSSISGDALYAVSAEGAFNAETANYSYVAETANYVADGWEYDASSNITGYSGSAFAATGAGKIYDGIAPIVVNNDEDKISANTIELSAGNGIDITEIADKVVISCTAGGGEGKVYTGVAPIVVDNSQTTGVVSVQTARLGVQSPLYFVEDTSASTVIGISGDLTGQYIPYTNITTGISGTEAYNVNKSIRVTSNSGWVEMYNQNKENENEAHLQVGQNYDNGKSFWSELDGAGGGFLQLNWNSGTVSPNAHSSYSDGTTAAMSLGNGALVYRSANSALTSLDDEASKVWQLGSERVRFWNQWGTASFGPRGMEIYDSAGNNHWYTTAADSATRFRIIGSAGDGTRGAVDLTPGYINFYNEDWSLNQTWNVGNIADTKALYNHVQSASANWGGGKTYTGVSPVVVNNTNDTISVTGYDISGINISITQDDVNHLIIFSGSTGSTITYTTGTI